MFGRKSLPIGVMVMLLIVALASLGVAYGMWEKTLYIDGTVETGRVDAEMSIYDWWETELKPVGECVPSLGYTNQENDTLFVRIENAYPSYECFVIFDVHNTGTIPIIAELPTVSYPDVMTVAIQDCPLPIQLEPSDMAYCTLYFHLEQNAAQWETYTFAGDLWVHQWNEP